MRHGAPPYITGAPGLTACARAMPARFSAVCTTSVPDRVTGPVAPVSGTEMISEGMPCLAASMMLCEVSTLQRSGEDGQASRMARGFSASAFSEPRTTLRISSVAGNDSSRKMPVMIGLSQVCTAM